MQFVSNHHVAHARTAYTDFDEPERKRHLLRLWLSVLLWFAWYGFPQELGEITVSQAGYAGLAAFFGPFAGRLSMMTSSRYLEARLTTLATLAAPPITLLLGVLLLSETPAPREVIGGLVMLVGIAIPVLGSRGAPR